MADTDLLAVSLRHRHGALFLAIEFRTCAPWTLLFGPSGVGKSTILRVIAGFLTPDHGSVSFGDPSLTLLDTGQRINLPAHQRPVRTAPQTPRLLPHRRVLSNLRYALGESQTAPEEADLVNTIVSLFRLDRVADRFPTDLSGGELQRVSVARAVLSAMTFSGPGRALLLLDEPFSGLDTALRDDLAVRLRDLLRQWQTPVLSVSHDIAEAFLLEAEVLRMSDGSIVQQGSAPEVLGAERKRLLDHLRA